MQASHVDLCVKLIALPNRHRDFQRRNVMDFVGRASVQCRMNAMGADKGTF